VSTFSFGRPTENTQEAINRWVEDALRQVERSTDVQEVLAEFSTTGSFTETRTFNASSATLGDLRNVLATMISDIKKKGQKRDYA
jgi:tripartite-type tricarboxylate transporter receptor subunit TctC